jgi:hypothetical protein
MKRQPMIPGLEIPVVKPHPSDDQIAKLSDRLLKLELEVTLLRILVEKGERAST